MSRHRAFLFLSIFFTIVMAVCSILLLRYSAEPEDDAGRDDRDAA